MLAVTDRAMDVLEGALEQNRGADEELLRITQIDGEARLTVQTQQPGDQLITRAERPVLAVAEDVSGALDGLTLDIDEAPSGVRLVFRESGE
jgi:hypothetical protein